MMSGPRKFVISDLHLGHTNILKYSNGLRGGTTPEEHDQWIIDQWNSVVTKHDLVYVLGDVAMNRQALALVKKLKGSKHLCKGNHDIESLQAYQEYFATIYGIHNYKRTFWMTHAPVHPGSLRGLFNLAGHTHQNSVTLSDGSIDHRYINCCVESTYGIPQSLDVLFEKCWPIVQRNKEAMKHGQAPLYI
jgi:calcineurin-like phosphoesterase family protein